MEKSVNIFVCCAVGSMSGEATKHVNKISLAKLIKLSRLDLDEESEAY